eukprot:Skav231254  [mRNA]  locus=scaffold411:606216:607448:- [translate_table: standard]
MNHINFVACLVLSWNLMQQPRLGALLQFTTILISYPVFVRADSMSEDDRSGVIVKTALICLQFMWAISVVNETDFVTFCNLEKCLCVEMIVLSLVLIDLKVMLPLYLCEATLLVGNQCRLMGIDNLSSWTLLVSAISHLFVAVAMVFADLTMRSMIVARLDSSEASSRMLGFRQVLRGVCDGDLLLDQSCTILDDASSLERLLKSGKDLVKTNFLDLFLDAGSRGGFVEFLNTQDDSADAKFRMPSALRVRLQGSAGPVSIDVFHTKVSNAGGPGIDYCLLALREDPEQSTPPDAPPNSAPAVHQVAPEPSQGSAASEIVDSYNELMEFALLVSNETSLFDIKEVHLVFKRETPVPALNSMPTLRRFIRPTDWYRVEEMFQNLIGLPPAEMQQRCTFRHPMLVRIPGPAA